MQSQYIYGPDFDTSDDDGLSDDNEYVEFMHKIKSKQRQTAQKLESEADKEKRRLKSIFSAISFGKDEIVFEEFDKGLDVNVDLDLEWTPLLLAATTANVRIFSGLIERGANVNQTRDGGTSALMYLCSITSNDDTMEEDIQACVKLLLEKKANVDAIDNKRRTAIMGAAYHGHFGVVKLLLPLVDRETVDNQAWDVLFWAVEGDQLPIVKYLLDESFNSTRTDIRGNSVVDIARNNGNENILELFPEDPFDEFYSHLNSIMSFEDIFNSGSPQFFTDICKILYGTKSEHVMPLLRGRNTTLSEFLSLNDPQLQALGVKFPYQRKRILEGLYRFHKHPFKPQSIPFVKKDQLYTNADVAASVLTCVKQVIAMEAGLKFMLGNNPHEFLDADMEEVKSLLVKNRQQLARLRVVVRHLQKRSEEWDRGLKPADRITKLRRNVPWGYVCLAVGGIVSVLIGYRLR